MLNCTPANLIETIWPLVKADIPVCIHGETGIGKSQMIRDQLMPLIEREFGPSVLHDHRLSSKDISDGTGIPDIDRETRSTYWTRPAFIPAEDGKMHVVLLDEIGHASIQMQHAVGYQLVLDRGLGEYKLPKQNRLILCMNTKADRGGDIRLAKPFENRMAHVKLSADVKSSVNYWVEKGVDPRLIAFHQTMAGMGYLHKMSDENPAFPTPRSITDLSKVMANKESDAVIVNCAMALCGEGYAMALASFLKDLGAKLPRLADIKANPTKASVPDEVNYQVVVATAIAACMKPEDAEIWIKYLRRLEADVASMAANKAKGRDARLSSVVADLIM